MIKTLTENSKLIDYIRLSRVWKEKPLIDLPLRFRFFYLKFWQFESVLYNIAFEDFILISKYKDNIEYIVEVLIRSYAKQWRWLLRMLVLKMPIKKVLPIYESYINQISDIEKKINEQSALYISTENQKYDLSEFGLTNITYMLSGGDSEKMERYYNKQPVVFIITEYRRFLKMQENERYRFEKMKKNNLQ